MTQTGKGTVTLCFHLRYRVQTASSVAALCKQNGACCCARRRTEGCWRPTWCCSWPWTRPRPPTVAASVMSATRSWSFSSRSAALLYNAGCNTCRAQAPAIFQMSSRIRPLLDGQD